MGKPKKIAIACQGGGSQTAFTAGVLQTFFKHKLHEKQEIVSFSGSSGGAVCATLAWYGMLKAAQGDPTPVAERLDSLFRFRDAMIRFFGLVRSWPKKYQ